MKLVKTPTILWLASLTMIVAGMGCEQQNQMTTKPTTSPTVAAVEQPLVEDTNEISALAAQSQRDVDLILKSRPLSGEVKPPIESNPQPPVSNRIVWNESKPATVQSPSNATSPIAPTIPPPDSPLTAEVAESPAPTNALKPDRLKSLMVDLSRELYASGSYSETPLRELLMIAAMSMVDPTRQLDPQAIPDLNDAERELLGKLQGFFAALGRSMDGGNDPEMAIIDAVAKLREALVKPPILRLPTAVLCTRVGGFGDYSAFSKDSFMAQAQQKVIVYLEIADFTSELNQKNEFVTQIAQQLTIYSDRDGIPVWKEDWQTAVDVTKNKRQDFFTVQVVTLPKALTVGKYQLKIRARDEKSGAEAEAMIPFELVADPRLAATIGK